MPQPHLSQRMGGQGVRWLMFHFVLRFSAIRRYLLKYVSTWFTISCRRLLRSTGGRDYLRRIKHTISLALDIAAEQLNEISLEDVEIEQDSQDHIYQVLYDMVLKEGVEGYPRDPDASPKGVPCAGFWVEETQELILFVWNRDWTKTIIVPPGEWFLRDDITLN